MKNRKLSTALLVVFAVFCMIVGLGIHYYHRISSFQIPEGAEVLGVNVGINDIYGVHISCEEIVKTDMDYEAFDAYMSSDPAFDRFRYTEITYEAEYDNYIIEMSDDYLIDPDEFIDGPPEDGMHYYLVSDDTPYFKFWGHMR